MPSPAPQPVAQLAVPRRTGRVRAVAAVASIALSVALAATGCTVGGPQHSDGTMPSSAATADTARVSSAPLETTTTSSTSNTIPVYWLGHSGSDVFLYREFMTDNVKDDPIVAALETMMSMRPLDPDYFTVWKKPSRLGASISAQNVITVDISSDAFSSNVDQGIAERSVDQLVYTATAAAAMAGLIDPTQSVQVSILVDGHTGYSAFGKVDLDRPLARDPRYIAPIWIIDPANGASLKAPVKVSGQAVSITGTLQWQLLAVANGTAGRIVSSGTVTIGGGANQLGAFSFSLMPAPGSYELRVFTVDPSAPTISAGVDSKAITVN